MLAPVTLSVWSLATSSAGLGAFQACLSPDETARMDRFIHPRHAIAYAAARGGLRERLGRLMGMAPTDLTFDYGPQGKPSLAGGPQFNLSHSGGYACLAIHPDLTLGVDIETHREIEPGVARRFFSPVENRALAALPDDDWTAGFFRCWTRKEAVVKALGGGLSVPLEAFDVTLHPIDARLTRMETDRGKVSDWSLAAFDLGKAMPGAVAARTGGAPVTLRLEEGPPGMVISFV